MKYGELNLGQMEAIVNKLGGMDGVKRFLNGTLVVVAAILRINRAKPFDPAKFGFPGWKVHEQDEKSLLVTELVLDKIQFKRPVRDDDNCVSGPRKLRRIKDAGYIRLDAAMCQAFWENQRMIPDAWKDFGYGFSEHVCFDGTILRQEPNGWDDYVLAILWDSDRGCWKKELLKVDDEPYHRTESAVLENV